MTDEDLEMRFWGDCCNTYGEETKQLVYLNRMGFKIAPTWRSPVSFDGDGKSFLDIGGGPCSVLLKFENVGRRIVVDPGNYPDWITKRYQQAGIEHVRLRAEEFKRDWIMLDCALIYNCLQHVDDPRVIVENAIASSRELKMFEWIDIPPHEGHPHMLTEAMLNAWTGQHGTVEQMNQDGCVGRAWYI
jgi:hypothetical protein